MFISAMAAVLELKSAHRARRAAGHPHVQWPRVEAGEAARIVAHMKYRASMRKGLGAVLKAMNFAEGGSTPPAHGEEAPAA